MSIYFDNNATAPIDPEVAEVVKRVSIDVVGNASSTHSFGQRAWGVIEDAREQVAALVGARPNEVVFTSGGTEANNQAIHSALAAARGAGQERELVVSRIEHPSVLRVAEELERSGQARLIRVAPRSGGSSILPEAVAESLTRSTALVSVMLVNNETGVIQSVREIALIARERGVPVHSDCVQAAGKIPIDIGELGAAYITLSAHKIHGPMGVGALIARGTPVRPLILGGTQEKQRRAGTENVAGIAGFGEACKLATRRMDQAATRCGEIRDRFERGVLELGAVVFGKDAPRVSNTCFFGFPGMDGQKILIGLDLDGIALSTGAACSSGLIEPSHVLLASGVAPDLCRSAVRFSCGPGNTHEEIESVLQSIRNVLDRCTWIRG